MWRTEGGKTEVMGRKRRRSRPAKQRGGALSSLRGGFRSTVHGVTGVGKPGPSSTRGRLLTTVIAVVMLAATVALVLRRMGRLR
jgi:hypothetical protein